MTRCLVASVIGLGLCMTACAQQQVQARPSFQSVAVGQKAPDFDAYTTSGKKVLLSDYKGKVVILDFWATWCGPCQVSMPGLEKIYSQIKGKNVVVLSLNTWDDKAAFKDWVQLNSGTKYHFDFVRDPAEGDHAGIRKASIAKRLYKVIGIPTMYVIDKQGNIAGSLIGSGNEAKLVEILSKLGISATVP
ncbi:MAG: TlpA disulfide reductase family protein [Fimbriimonas sp.]|nr:TlpA disulfide reductase family protein [Fimbriimonas sp.]